MYRSLTLAGLWLLAAMPMARADQASSLADIIRMAERASASLAADRSDVEAAGLATSSSLADYLPSLGLRGTLSRADRDTTIPLPAGPGNGVTNIKTAGRDEYQAVAQLDIPLFDVAKIRRSRESSAREAVASARAAQRRFELEREVATKWLEVVGANLSVKVAERTLRLAEATVAATSRRAASGRVTAAEESRQEAQLAEAHANHSVAKAEALRATASLHSLLGDGAERILVGAPEPTYLVEIEQEDPGQLARRALSRDPSIVEAQARVDEARASRRVRDAEAWPTLSAFASRELARSEGLSGPKTRAGLSLAWTLGVAQSLSEEVAAVTVTAESARLEAAKSRAMAHLQDARQRLEVAKLRLEATKARVASLEQDRFLREKQLASGTATSLDLAGAASAVFEAENARTKALVDVIARRIDLVHASGRSLLEAADAAAAASAEGGRK